MSLSECRIYLGNDPADENLLDLFSEIKVDQAIGMASEAELQMTVGADENGNWSGMEDAFSQPFERVRVEVSIGRAEFVPIIDGPIVAQRFELSAIPNNSHMVLVVQDDSVLLNHDEQVQLFEDRSPDEIAGALFQQYGLRTETDPVQVPAGGLERTIVQRGTAMQLLRELARRHGMFVYVRAGSRQGESVGVFKQPALSSGDYPELQLMGAHRNINHFSARFDGLRPLRARADNVDITNQERLTSESRRSELDSQGDTAVHDILEAGLTLLARTREAPTDLDAATASAVNHSSWAYVANAEVVADTYSAVLMPYNVITVSGTGGYLSGDWLISHVTHTINDESYRQQFTLRRNARSNGTGGGSTGLGGGVF